MKVLVVSDFFLSGQTTHVFDLIQQLVLRQDCKVLAVFSSIHSPKFYSYHASILKKHKVPYKIAKTNQALAQIIQNFRPDVIHCHSSTLFDRVKEVAKMAGIPYVITCHGLGLDRRKYHDALSEADALIAVGENTARPLRRLFADKIHVIKNGVDIRKFTPSAKSSIKRVYYVARMEQTKVRALRALARAVRQIPTLELVVISDWMPAIDGVTYLPWQTDLAKILSKTNIVAACGRTAREAMAAGNVVLLINRRYDGIVSPDLVSKSDFDFSGNIGRYPLLQIGNDLRKLINDKELMLSLQEFSKNYARKHLDSADMAAKVYEVYASVVKNKGAPKSPLIHKLRVSGWGLKI